MPERRELSVWHCRACSRPDSGPFARCPRCASADVEIESVAGDGALVSWTIVRRPPPAFRELGAYAVGIVDLEGGLRVLGRLAIDTEVLRVSLPVSLADVVDGAPIFKMRGDGA